MGEPDDDQALRAKLDALKGALERRRAEKRAGEAAGPSESERAATASAISLGLRASAEFAAPIVVGGLIGWRLDVWLGTKPAFLIALFLLGAAAGVWNVVRTTSPKGPADDRNSSLSGDAAPDKDGRRSAPAGRAEAPGGADDDED
ncbi:MAG: AtpZ/AtpI family protein [Roseiarcus sp.]|jgi:ATP synthase protein I